MSIIHPMIHVDLPEGLVHPFEIISACARSARAAGVSRAELDVFIEAATSGDYDHVTRTARKWFSCYGREEVDEEM